MLPCEMARYIAGFWREARKYAPFSGHRLRPLTVLGDSDTIRPCTSRFLVEYPTLRPSLRGQGFAKSPGCERSMGVADGANARELRGCGWRMALSIWLKYTGTKPPDWDGKSTRSSNCFEIKHGKDTSQTIGRLRR